MIQWEELEYVDSCLYAVETKVRFRNADGLGNRKGKESLSIERTIVHLTSRSFRCWVWTFPSNPFFALHVSSSFTKIGENGVSQTNEKSGNLGLWSGVKWAKRRVRGQGRRRVGDREARRG